MGRAWRGSPSTLPQTSFATVATRCGREQVAHVTEAADPPRPIFIQRGTRRKSCIPPSELLAGDAVLVAQQQGGSAPPATRSAPAPAVRKAGASAFGLRLKRGRPWAVKRRECREPGSTSKQSGAERFRSSPVAGTLNTDERALGHTSSGHSVARGDRLHLVASAAHLGSATVFRGAHARTPLGLGPG